MSTNSGDRGPDNADIHGIVDKQSMDAFTSPLLRLHALHILLAER